MFDVRVSRYLLGGARQGVLATLGCDLTDPWASIACKVSEEIVDTLPDLIELQADYWNETEWVEAPNLRTIVVSGDVDEKDPAKVRSLSSVWLFQYFLGKLPVFDPPDLDDLVDGHRMFNSATPGSILKTLIDEGVTAGWGTDTAWDAPLGYDFTASTDSAGVAWPSQLSIGYEPGTDVWTVLGNLVDQDLIDVGSDGRTLHAWVSGHGVDRSTGGAPVQLGTRASGLPIKRDLSDLTTTAIVRGEGSFRLTLESDTYVPGAGKLFTTINQGGVSDTGTATLLAQADLTKGSQVREQISATGNAVSALFLPWIDFAVGDWVNAWIKAVWQRVRVAELVVSKDNTGKITVSPVLNDRFLELLARIAKRTTGIVGGATAGGSGGIPSTGDKRAPKAPTDLLLSSTGYWSEGTPLSQLSAGWSAVTEAVNDVAIDVSLYEVWVRRDSGGESSILTSTDAITVSWSPFTPGETWWVKVRAKSANDVWGGFCTEVSVVMQKPEFDLNTPSTPVLSTSNGVVQVVWDGLFATDPPTLPPDYFLQMNVEMSDAEDGNFSLVGTVREGQERISLIGLGVGSTWWLRFVAVDKLGRPSDAGDAASVTVEGIDGADVVVSTLNGNTLIAGSVETQALSPSVGGDLDISANDTVTIMAGQVQTVSDAVDGVSSDLDDTNQTIVDMRTYYQFGADGAVISKPGSPVSFVLNNTGAQIEESGVSVSSWTNKQFFSRSIVADSISTGNHQIASHGTGSVVKAL